MTQKMNFRDKIEREEGEGVVVEIVDTELTMSSTEKVKVNLCLGEEMLLSKRGS